MSMNEITPEFRRKAQEIFDTIPFVKLLGMELGELAPGRASMSVALREDLMRHMGLLHGGVTASLIDSATAFAVATLLSEGEHAVTVDLTIHYLRPVTEGSARCEAKVLRAGKRLLTVSAEVFNDRDKLIATALSTYSKI
jgi:uncharacterized protein (TIGR00369 family)